MNSKLFGNIPQTRMREIEQHTEKFMSMIMLREPNLNLGSKLLLNYSNLYKGEEKDFVEMLIGINLEQRRNDE